MASALFLVTSFCACAPVVKTIAREAAERVAVKTEQVAIRTAERTVVEHEAAVAAAAISRTELLSSIPLSVESGVKGHLDEQLSERTSRFVEFAKEEEQKMKSADPARYEEPVEEASCGERKSSFEPNHGTDATDAEIETLRARVDNIDASFTPIHVDGTASGDATCRWRGLRFAVTLSGTPTVLAYRNQANEMKYVLLDFEPSFKVRPAV
jgi:hypothetical protein